jgi:hypothetical protein
MDIRQRRKIRRIDLGDAVEVDHSRLMRAYAQVTYLLLIIA